MSRVIACWSPVHAQGTSFVAMVSAITAMGKQKTLLIDANFMNPMLAQLIGIEPSHRIEQLFPFIAGHTLNSDVFRVHLQKKGSLSLLAGMGRKELAQEDETAEYMTKVLQFARTEFDLIIVDAGSGINHAGSYTAIAGSDQVMVVLEPNFVAGKALRRWQFNIDDVLPKALHAPKAGVILNRWEKKLLVAKNEISNYCELPLWAVLPNEHVGFLNALNKGELWKFAGDNMWSSPMAQAIKESEGVSN